MCVCWDQLSLKLPSVCLHYGNSVSDGPQSHTASDKHRNEQSEGQLVPHKHSETNTTKYVQENENTL